MIYNIDETFRDPTDTLFHFDLIMNGHKHGERAWEQAPVCGDIFKLEPYWYSISYFVVQDGRLQAELLFENFND